MKKNTSQKLSKRLAQYGALSIAVAGITNATGQNIIYTPDVNEGGPGYFYLLNMDNAGPDEFSIKHFNSLTPSGSYNYNSLIADVISASINTNNALFGYDAGAWQYPFALDSGVIISNSMAVSSQSNFGSYVAGAWINDGSQTLNINSCVFSFDNWCPNQGDKFLGLKFEIAGKVLFGWARIEVGATAGDWTIKDYAYNSNDTDENGIGDPINAGQPLGIDDNTFSKVKVVALDKSIGIYNLQDISNYSVINMTGQKVLDGTTNNRDYVIEAPTLASGVYVVELSDTNSDAVLRKKVVLQ